MNNDTSTKYISTKTMAKTLLQLSDINISQGSVATC